MPGINDIPLFDSRPGVDVLAREASGWSEDVLVLFKSLLG